MRLAIALLLFALFQSATAETRYVGVSTLNVRDQTSGAIVAKLERGAAVEVVESNNALDQTIASVVGVEGFVLPQVATSAIAELLFSIHVCPIRRNRASVLTS